MKLLFHSALFIIAIVLAGSGSGYIALLSESGMNMSKIIALKVVLVLTSSCLIIASVWIMTNSLDNHRSD